MCPKTKFIICQTKGKAVDHSLKLLDDNNESDQHDPNLISEIDQMYVLYCTVLHIYTSHSDKQRRVYTVYYQAFTLRNSLHLIIAPNTAIQTQQISSLY
jgi:hypothetical protein